MSICQVCQHKAPRECEHSHLTREYYGVLYAALKHVAYRYGYTLAVHGSLSYDIDLVAVPWRDSAVSAESLVEGIKKACESIIGFAEFREGDPNPAKKPCGRLAWSIYLVPPDHYKGPYIDLSVMPIGLSVMPIGKDK